MRRIALITGATSGIGRATAKRLAKVGFDLIVCGRRKERLDELEQELSATVKVLKLVFDVSKSDEVVIAFSSLEDDWKNIDVLINNAGNAHGLAPIQEGDLEDWENMININVKGLLYVSKEVIPGMVKQQKGHIVNIGSIAGKEVYPNGNVYCASKFAVDALSKGMRMDLNKFGIKVSEVNPGLVNTEFSTVRFKGDQKRAEAVYAGLMPLSAEDVAEVIEFMVTRPAHVNISELTILPTAQASATIVNKETKQG